MWCDDPARISDSLWAIALLTSSLLIIFIAVVLVLAIAGLASEQPNQRSGAHYPSSISAIKQAILRGAQSRLTAKMPRCATRGQSEGKDSGKDVLKVERLHFPHRKTTKSSKISKIRLNLIVFDQIRLHLSKTLAPPLTDVKVYLTLVAFVLLQVSLHALY